MKKRICLCLTLIVIVIVHSEMLEARQKCSADIAELFQRVSPSVVTVTGTSLNPFSLNDRIRVSMGSGFVVDAKGYILTNSHVVFGAQVIMIYLNDGSSLKAKLTGADPLFDLAVLQVDQLPKKLKALPMAKAEALVVGEDVVAIGNPLGLVQTITRGIISGLNRVLPVSPMSYTVPMIQTDASINPGNSGGPLLNFCGEVLGINTAGIIGAENVGFAVPATIIKDAYPQLLENGRIIRPWIGISGKLIQAADLSRLFNLPLVDGFLIEAVEPGSPAEAAGLIGGSLSIKVMNDAILFGGDIVTSINGASMSNPVNYLNMVRKLKVGETVKLEIYRDGYQHKFSLKTIERPILPWDLPVDN